MKRACYLSWQPARTMSRGPSMHGREGGLHCKEMSQADCSVHGSWDQQSRFPSGKIVGAHSPRPQNAQTHTYRWLSSLQCQPMIPAHRLQQVPVCTRFVCTFGSNACRTRIKLATLWLGGGGMHWKCSEIKLHSHVKPHTHP